MTWLEIVKRTAPLSYVNGMVVLIGDGMKQTKEARRMPGVKKLHQESENSSKAEYIFGHLFGAVGILMGTPQKLFCLPLFMNLQDGVKTIFSWNDPLARQDSHVVQMIEQGFLATKTFGKSLFLLDRYFLSVPALERLNELNASQWACCNWSQYVIHRLCQTYSSGISERLPRPLFPKQRSWFIYVNLFFDCLLATRIYP